jgi:hypothetical protein
MRATCRRWPTSCDCSGADVISIIDNAGHERFLGNLPPSDGLRYGWTVYGDRRDTPMVPRSRWPELIGQMTPGPDFPFLPYVHDQDGVGQCNADATVSVIESCRLSQGLPFVKLSAADLYHRINGGQDQGSLLEDGIAEAMKNGVGTADTCGTLWKRGMRTASPDERGRFKVLEAFLCPTFDHCMSAVLMGFRLVSGIMWYQNYNVDSEGWLPLRGQGSPGGHAVFGYKPAMRQAQGGTVFGIWHRNSWANNWGINGDGVFPEPAYKGPVGGWWAARSVTDEGGVVPQPQ